MKSTKHDYQLFEKGIQDLMKKIGSDIQWLDRHYMESIYSSETPFDPSVLVSLKERLEKRAEDLARENYAMAGCRGYSLYLLESDLDYQQCMRTSIEELANQG
jgi:hypothetical protein